MNLDEYDTLLDQFADELDLADGAWESFVSGLFESSAEATQCVTLRQAMLTDADIETCRGYLEIGYFPGADEDRRLAWWAFALELTARYESRSIERRCALYQRDQPLFVGAPKLFDEIRTREDGSGPDLELINDDAIRSIDRSEVYKVGRGFAKLPPELKPTIPIWAREAYPDAPLFLRLDPTRHFEAEPLRTLTEAAMVPANPHWLETLALFADTSTYAQYNLLGDLKAEGLEAYRDFSIRHVRRLEVRATRREADYLSMIIEELPQADATNGLMIGRCIHLDTRAPIGSPMKDAQLQHLDLAINVYARGDRALRLANTLQHGKSQSATFRTHLLRIEAVPFPALFVFAEMFFRSRTLVREWMDAALPGGGSLPNR